MSTRINLVTNAVNTKHHFGIIVSRILYPARNNHVQHFVIADVRLNLTSYTSIIKDVTSQNKVDKLVFLGDYFDDWGQQLNNKLYEET